MFGKFEFVGLAIMWTERLKVLDDYHEIISYIKSMDYFHDFRLGTIELGENAAKITIESDFKNSHNQNALIWNFSFDNISDLKVEIDCIIPSYIMEIEIEGYLVIINLNNGFFSFKMENMSLGIPKS